MGGYSDKNVGRSDLEEMTEAMTVVKQRQKVRKALSPIMFFLFPVIYYYFSPYLIIMGAAEGIIVGSFIVFAGLFFTLLLAGRVFCGWICPAGAMQELCFKVNGRNFKGGKRN